MTEHNDVAVGVEWTRIPHGVRLRHADGNIEVRIPVPGVASVVRCVGDPAAYRGFFADPSADAPTVTITRRDTTLRLVGGGVTVLVDLRSGALTFQDEAGSSRLAEAPAPRPLPGIGVGAVQAFTIGADEALHGLGQFRAAPFDYRDAAVFLAQSNSDAVNPFLVSTGGWGLLWDTGTAAHFRSAGTRITFHSVAGGLVRYHVCLGPDLAEVIRGYRRLTGPAPLFGRWAYGYWQSQERYGTEREVLDIAAGYRERDLPLDVVVLDWRYWGDNELWSGMVFDPDMFPDPRGMVDRLHADDVRIIASVWPALGPASAVYRELDDAGLLFTGPHHSGGRVYDAASPEAREIYWRHVRAGLIDVGVDGLWTDGNEPEFRTTGDRYVTAQAYTANGSSAAGPIEEDLLTFSYRHNRGLFEAMRRERPQTRPFLLSRSAYAGQQAYGSVTWSGDIHASWQTLRDQLIAAQNFALSGIPYWTCDIGAFLVGHRYPDALHDPAYRELYVRWFQFGAMLPIFRAHGSQIPRHVWAFGEPGDPVYDALAAMLRLRYALLPYIYSAAAAVTHDGDTLLRPLVLDFPDDAQARDRPEQFMFGPALLVRVVDRPLLHTVRTTYELLPPDSVRGVSAPAADVTFFEGTNFNRQVSRRLTDDLKMSWFGDLPPELAGRPYSVRWQGRIAAAESGTCTMALSGAGGVRLVLDGAVLVDATVHGGEPPLTADVELIGGTLYDFTLELRQPTPDVVDIWLEWLTPTQRALGTPPEQPAVDVYLPEGSDWYDVVTAERFAGGVMVTAEAPLDHLPLYARAGAVIPTTPGVTRASARVEWLDVRVFAGADGVFVLYEDEGDGHAYQEGTFATVPLRWSEADGTLTVGPRSGTFPGVPAEMAVTATLTEGPGPAAGTGLPWAGGPAASGVFDGTLLVLALRG